MGNLQRQAKQIAEAIVDLRDDFKDALIQKGVAEPGNDISEYPSKILEIPAGGGAAGAFGSFRVDWLDYDGSILKTEYVGLGEAATPPDTTGLVVLSHDGVTPVASFSGWCVPASVYGVVLCDMQIMAGYTVSTCAARVYAKAGDTVVLPFTASNGSVTVDWGEGEPETFANGSQLQHTYTADFAGVVAFDDTYAMIYNPNTTGVPTCNGVEGVFVHAGGRFGGLTEENLLTHGFDSSTYYICDFMAQPLCSAPRGQRFLCLDSSTPWAVKMPSYGTGKTFTVIDGPSVAGCDNNGYFYGTYSAISVPKLFGAYYSSPSGSGINESSVALSYTIAPFIYNEGMPSAKFGYSSLATMKDGVIYVKATTVDVGASKCLIAPNATTLKIANTRFYHKRIVAPLCESVEAATAPSSGGEYGYLEEITLKNGVSISAGNVNIVCSYMISPRNVVDVFSKLPAGSGVIYVINRIYDALSADEIAIATEKGYTITAVSALQ